MIVRLAAPATSMLVEEDWHPKITWYSACGAIGRARCRFQRSQQMVKLATASRDGLRLLW